MPLWIVATIAGALVLFLLGYLLAVWGIRHGIRTHADLSARIYAERQAERAAAGRDDTPGAQRGT